MVIITRKVTKKFETKYASEILVPFIGETRKSFKCPSILSIIIIMFEQNATVTELTPIIDDMSHAPAIPSIILLSTEKLSGNAIVKLSMYTLRRKVANSNNRMSGVNKEMKKVNLSLK